MCLIRVSFSFEKLRSRYKFIFFYLGREKFVYYYCCTDSFSPLILCLRVKPNPRLGSLTLWISSQSKLSKTHQVAYYPVQNIPAWTLKIHGSAANPGLKKSLKLDVNGFCLHYVLFLLHIMFNWKILPITEMGFVNCVKVSLNLKNANTLTNP